ncbi:hypothetical protein ABEB36_007648 [Hypothenemus hampei]|uniref:Uncharacterized protein n=1 Tax=Hypothenemus hampei TaxID=57062 RepID=A0ABD1EUT2_HYPHA
MIIYNAKVRQFETLAKAIKVGDEDDCCGMRCIYRTWWSMSVVAFLLVRGPHVAHYNREVSMILFLLMDDGAGPGLDISGLLRSDPELSFFKQE